MSSKLLIQDGPIGHIMSLHLLLFSLPGFLKTREGRLKLKGDYRDGNLLAHFKQVEASSGGFIIAYATKNFLPYPLRCHRVNVSEEILISTAQCLLCLF